VTGSLPRSQPSFLSASFRKIVGHGPEPVDLSFAPEAWGKILRDRRRPSRLVRRHFEACVFSYLAAELRAGDIAVVGSESFANLHEQLLS
jgi:hypothetical protein